MPVSDRDFALLTEELKCLRKKFNTALSTAGGYLNGPLTAPDSSIFPNTNYDDCSCVSTEPVQPDPLTACAQEEIEDVPLGDFANESIYNPIEGLFVFDALSGVLYKGPDEETYENRNTGLSSTTLEHGCLDEWWYRKQSPDENSVILWRVGDGKILRSTNSGRRGWNSRTPSNVPTGYTINDIKFTQIVSDPFEQNYFYVIATTHTAPYKTWILKTTDNGQEWTWTDITNYNSATSRKPGWLAVGGNGGGLLWLTTWIDNNTIELLKINNDPTLTVSSSYDLGTATEFEWDNRIYWSGASCALDSSGSVWFFGRMNDPQGLGLSHIIRTDNEGLDWEVVENTWEDDWCGSFKVSLSVDGTRNFYSVRNER